MRYLNIKQKFNFKNSILSLQCNSFSTFALFYIFLSLMIFVIDIKKPHYFDSIKENILTSKIVKIINIPGNIIDKIIVILNNHLILYQENERLKLQTSISPFEFEKSKQENLELKNLLNFVRKNNFQVIASSIIRIVHNNFADYGIINIGSLQGIKSGQAVVNENGLIGRIVDTSDNTAKILFLYNNNFRVSAKSLNSKVEAIVTGANDKQKLLMVHINDKKEQFHNGDYVVTSGDFPHFPSGILIGKFKSPNSIIMNINWHKLDLVSIIASNQ